MTENIACPIDRRIVRVIACFSVPQVAATQMIERGAEYGAKTVSVLLGQCSMQLARAPAEAPREEALGSGEHAGH